MLIGDVIGKLMVKNFEIKCFELIICDYFNISVCFLIEESKLFIVIVYNFFVWDLILYVCLLVVMVLMVVFGL